MPFLSFSSAPSFMLDEDEFTWGEMLSTSEGTHVLGCSQNWFFLQILKHLQNAQHWLGSPLREEVILHPFCAMFYLLGTKHALFNKELLQFLGHARHIIGTQLFSPPPFPLSLKPSPLHPLQAVQATHINKHAPGQFSRHVWILVSASFGLILLHSKSIMSICGVHTGCPSELSSWDAF